MHESEAIAGDPRVVGHRGYDGWRTFSQRCGPGTGCRAAAAGGDLLQVAGLRRATDSLRSRALNVRRRCTLLRGPVATAGSADRREPRPAWFLTACGRDDLEWARRLGRRTAQAHTLAPIPMACRRPRRLSRRGAHRAGRRVPSPARRRRRRDDRCYAPTRGDLDPDGIHRLQPLPGGRSCADADSIVLTTVSAQPRIRHDPAADRYGDGARE